jgi:hypothetical protein
MPDITMCQGNDCPLKKTCYRHKATPSKFRQSYFIEAPYKDENCSHYWEIEMSSKQSKKLDKNK